MIGESTIHPRSLRVQVAHVWLWKTPAIIVDNMEVAYKPRIWSDPLTHSKRMKHAARKRVSNALKRGALVKLPCEFADCMDQETEAHHPDYDRPLDVLWLCRDHHLELHRLT